MISTEERLDKDTLEIKKRQSYINKCKCTLVASLK